MRTLVIQILLCICLIQLGQAQSDTVVWPLPTIKVLDAHPPVMHYDLLEADSTSEPLSPLIFSTSELLQFKSGAYLRDYGNQTLSTLSIRGGSSQQTEILWNGARISNPMLGLGDISMLPIMAFTEIQLQSYQQNGAYNPIGGVLNLHNNFSESNGYMIGLSAGQFGHFKTFAQAQYQFSKSLKAKLKFFSIREEQDFPYQDEHTSVLLPDRQPHAVILQQGVMGHLSYRPNDHHNINASFWWQGNRREIPPLITQSKSEAVQHDSFYRAQIEWGSQWERYQHELRITNRKEANVYEDPQNGVSNQNEFQSVQAQSEHQYQPAQNWNLKYGLSFEHINARTGNYLQDQTTDILLAYFNPVYTLSRVPLQFDGAIRYSQQGEQIAPPGGHMALKWLLKRQIISLSFHQANRFPSLNDIYWRPGGNPDLRPEFSQQWNFAYAHQQQWKQTKLSHQLNVFYKNVDDWILWAPTEQFIWKPDNLISVVSAGVEYTVDLSYNFSASDRIAFEGNLLYQYVRNTGPNTPLAQKDRNLIYMPTSTMNGSISYHKGPFKLTYLHHYRSKVYTRPNLSDHLDPLHLGQVRLSKTLHAYGQMIQAYVQVNNIWDQSYFFQPNRPAPGRYWRFGLLIQNQ